MDHIEFRHDIGKLAEAGWDLRTSLIEANLFGPDVVALENAVLQLEQSMLVLGALPQQSPPES